VDSAEDASTPPQLAAVLAALSGGDTPVARAGAGDAALTTAQDPTAAAPTASPPLTSSPATSTAATAPALPTASQVPGPQAVTEEADSPGPSPDNSPSGSTPLLATATAGTTGAKVVASAASADTASAPHSAPATSGDAVPDVSAFGADPTAGRATAEAATYSAPQLQTQTPVGASGWSDEVGGQVLWMAHQGITSASLRLEPEHLGPLEVRISLHDTSASVWFGAHEPETRAALQTALPQLKEMFASQGMTLTDSGVSRESPRDAQSGPHSFTHSTTVPAAPSDPQAPATPRSARRGLLDTYA
jgi:flagellar hook-length control protein FliK